ncbi:hypothetical protein [Streptomyces chattanoogensis]|uniref:hypothetical protein n=1 Tax=Streptomyces chattanoogensis TaxID=66876 RepID=UPI0036AE1D1F
MHAENTIAAPGDSPVKSKRRTAKRRAFTLLATLSMASAAALSIAPGTAYAGDATVYTTDSPAGGRLKFVANGDDAFVCDLKSDGHGVRSFINFVDNSSGQHVIAFNWVAGKGACKNVLDGENLREGSKVSIEICLGKTSDNARENCREAQVTA